MNFESGHPIDDPEWYSANSVDPVKVVNNISYLFNEMMFVYGFLHSDPHPGNLKIRKRGPIGPVQVILLDHGQYRRLNSVFKSDYCNFLHAVVDFDEKKIHKYGERLNIDDVDLANQLACMMLGVRYKSFSEGGGLMSQGRDKKKSGWGEKAETKKIMDKHLDSSMDILNKIPPELVIIMKSNDLIRCLETKLTNGMNPENYVNMAYLCLMGMRSVELNNVDCYEERGKIYKKYFWSLSKVYWYQVYFKIVNGVAEKYKRYTGYYRRLANRKTV